VAQGATPPLRGTAPTAACHHGRHVRGRGRCRARAEGGRDGGLSGAEQGAAARADLSTRREQI